MDLHKVRKNARIGIAAASVLFTAGVPLVSAHGTVNSAIDTTGANSLNTVDVDDTHDLTVRLNNSSNTNNTTSATADTGDNRASFNTGDGFVRSGDVRGVIDNDVTVNTDSGSWTLPDFDDGSVTTSINRTGFSSDNNQNINSSSTRTIRVNNSATANNVTRGSINTGGNRSNSNTGSGDVSSGDASIEVRNRTDANANAGSALQALGSGSFSSGNIDATIDTTGANSSNTTNINTSSNTRITENNTANVNNSTTLDFNTGDNSASFNTGDGTVNGGDVDFGVSNTTVAN